jgi:hypothetical protein
MTNVFAVGEIEIEMRALAKARVERIAGDELLLKRRMAAQIFNKSESWVGRMIATGRLPSVRLGGTECVPRVAVINGLVRGM